ncbi:hypothetical protein [Yunchengibacter salinarum]|uniref:hypothetical protein n=1 Tax=Yunchengibacter salinarum TaxID=3133399 RepID=UPI0035B5F258
MTKAVKFQFDRNFESQGHSQLEAEVARLRQEVETTRQQAFQDGLSQGVEQGRQEALASIEKATEEALGHLSGVTRQLFDERAALVDSLKRDMVSLTRAIINKMAPSLANTNATDDIEQLVSDCLETALAAPRITVRLNEQVKEQIEPRLHQQAERLDFGGELAVTTDPSLSPQDMSVQWPDGSLVRDMDAIHQGISNALESFLGEEDPLADLENRATPEETSTTGGENRSEAEGDGESDTTGESEAEGESDTRSDGDNKQ